MTEKGNPALTEVSKPGHDEVATPNPNRPRRPTKEDRMLRILLERARSLNRFEAEDLGDHCLHSTVAALQSRKGLTIHREWETVPGYDGSLTRVKRYRLAPESRPMALALLGEAER